MKSSSNESQAGAPAMRDALRETRYKPNAAINGGNVRIIAKEFNKAIAKTRTL
jgi:hypothetical protein